MQPLSIDRHCAVSVDLRAAVLFENNARSLALKVNVVIRWLDQFLLDNKIAWVCIGFKFTLQLLLAITDH